MSLRWMRKGCRRKTGKRQPTLSVIFALAGALEVKPEKLIAETRAHLAG
jgi:hypothetical protein